MNKEKELAQVHKYKETGVVEGGKSMAKLTRFLSRKSKQDAWAAKQCESKESESGEASGKPQPEKQS